MPDATAMRIMVESEHSIRLAAGSGGALVEAGAEVGVSPFHLLGASLGACTWSVLEGWAEAAGLDVSGLEVEVEWEFGREPVRVSEFRLVVVWPGLPAERREAAERVAARCTVHHTLEHGSRVATRVEVGGGDGGDGPRRAGSR